MLNLPDILASGIHDAKNQLLQAESLVSQAEHAHGIDLAEARYAIEAAAERLSRTLGAYRLMRNDARIAVVPVVVADLLAELALNQRHHLESLGLVLDIDNAPPDEWPLDRDLITDMLNNALQNASRFAKTTVHLSAFIDEQGLCLRVEDDGPGFSTLPPAQGTGLAVADRLAALHQRGSTHGRLTLSNDSILGGARFELRLP